MGVKILHTADWHMDAPFSSFSEERRQALRRQQLTIPGKIAEICRRENCDLMLLAGDVFDGIPSRDAVEAVKKALAECAVPVFISPGNHDFCGPGSPWLEERWPENVHVFKGDLESAAVPQLDCRIYGAGYRSMDCGPLLENFEKTGQEQYHIGLLHGDPVTARSPYCPITAAQIRSSGLDYLALGHIHKSGSLAGGTTLCAWPGCPMGRGWDETGEKGLYLVTLEMDAKAEFLILDTPRFYDPEVDISDGLEQALDPVLPAAGTGDFFRVTLTGRGTVDTEDLQKQYAHIPNLVLRDRTQPEGDLWEDAGSDTFRGAYFRLLQEQAQTDPRAILAARISRKILEGREVKLP